MQKKNQERGKIKAKLKLKGYTKWTNLGKKLHDEPRYQNFDIEGAEV
jgi:hypothetical protein